MIKFELDGYYLYKSPYRHMVHVLAALTTTLYGTCFIAETSSPGAEFIAINMDTETNHWEVSTEEEWKKCFKQPDNS